MRKRLLTLGITFGVTFALLTPLFSNVPVFAQDEGVNIERIGDGEQTGQVLVDYNTYNGDTAKFEERIMELMASGSDMNIELYNVPEGYNLNLTNEEGEWSYPNLNIYVGGDGDAYKYISSLNYSNVSTINVTMPKLEDLYTDDDPVVNGLVVPGTKYYAFKYPDSLRDSNQYGLSRIMIPSKLIDFSKFGNIYFEHSYTKEQGINSVFQTEITDMVYIYDDFSSYFIANQRYDGSKEENPIVISTKDPTNPDQIKDLIQNSKEESFNFSVSDNVDKIPDTVFELFKEADKKIQLNGFTSTGQDYSLKFEKINEAISFNPQVDITKEEIEGVPVVTVDFKHSGKLPGPMKVCIFVGGEYNSKTAYLYYVNEDGVLEEQASSAKIELGYAEFIIDHCSSYVVSAKAIPGAIAAPTTDDNTDDEEEVSKPNTPAKEDSNDNVTDKETPNTGIESSMMSVFALFAVSGAVTLTAGILRKRNKASV